MKKLVISVIVFMLLFTSVAFGGDSDVPTEVPPCPDEYQGGLIP